MICFQSVAQTLSPSVISSYGNYSTGPGISLSATAGETFTSTLQNGSIILTQGEQQPYILLNILNLKMFIEGFYLGGGQMQAVLHNENPNLPSNYCDSITVNLYQQNPPYNLVASKNAIVLTDGSALLQFPSDLASSSYFIALSHRNSIETWSKYPVPFTNSTINFDFTKP